MNINDELDSKGVVPVTEETCRDFFRQAASAYNVDDFARALAAIPDGAVEEAGELEPAGVSYEAANQIKKATLAS